MGEYDLRTCVWELTLACTYSCEHCGSRAGKARDGELSTEEALRVAANLAHLDCERVIMIGGEVFLRDDWDVIAGRLTGAGVEVSVITNGSCFKADVWNRLREAGIDYVGISVDGLRDDHDAMRMSGSFDVAVNAVSEAKAQGFTVAVVTVLTSRNIGGIRELSSILEGKGADVWQLQLCSPFGNAKHSDGVVPPVEAISDVMSFVAERASANGADAGSMRVVAADNVGYFTRDEGLIRGQAGGCFPGCAAGLSVIGIDSVGNVRGCESLYDDCFIEGNLRERSLASIWNDPDAFAYNRQFSADLLSGTCRTCAEGYRCAAGCRSINHFLTGNMYESATCVRAHVR